MIIKNFLFIRMQNHKMDKKKVIKVIKINNTHRSKVIFNHRNQNNRINKILKNMKKYKQRTIKIVLKLRKK